MEIYHDIVDKLSEELEYKLYRSNAYGNYDFVEIMNNEDEYCYSFSIEKGQVRHNVDVKELAKRVSEKYDTKIKVVRDVEVQLGGELEETYAFQILTMSKPKVLLHEKYLYGC